MPDPRVLLLDADATAGENLASVLQRLGHGATQVSDPIEAIRRAPEFQLVVVDLVGDADPIQVVRELRATPEAASVPVLAVCQSDDVEERIKFLEAGADDAIAKPFDDRELEARLDALLLRFQRSSLLGSAAIDRTPVTGDSRRIIAVHSPKGGVGTTTIAVNLATVLARTRPDRVAIVDLDFDFGQVSTHLNLDSRATLIDAVRDELSLRDPDVLRSLLGRHSSGLLVLAAPGAPVSTDGSVPVTIDREAVATLLETLSRALDYVVVDAGSGLDRRTEAVLEMADAIVLPVTAEFPALKAVHALLDHFTETGSVSAKTTFVLNALYAREILKPSDIESALGTKIAIELPYDPFLYLKAVNEGVPIVIGAPRTRPAERFERLAQVVTGEAVPAPVPERRASRIKLFGRG
ncbi:MAG: AAA family ATPase [Chloroflexi bacterium]|nr:AAA family ATPase [Chloroflexota bacterium]